MFQENISNEKRRKEADKKEVEEKIRADQMKKLLSTTFAQVPYSFTILMIHRWQNLATMKIASFSGDSEREGRASVQRDGSGDSDAWAG